MRVRAIVHGRVQGVWFRDSCRREAERLGVTGWVRNRRDGCVEAEFEGSTTAVAELLAWCRVGPPRALVTKVEVSETPASGSETFVIRD